MKVRKDLGLRVEYIDLTRLVKELKSLAKSPKLTRSANWKVSEEARQVAQKSLIFKAALEVNNDTNN